MTLYRATSEGNIPMTPEEEAEFEASRAPSVDSLRAEIQREIESLERGSLENRGARELHLAEMEREAEARADALNTPENPITQADVLAQVPYYVKLKALDDQIKALRDQYNAL